MTTEASRALSDLQPDAVQAWLEARGWRDAGPEGPYARAWLKGHGGRQGEVLLPTRPTAPDYTRFMSILVDEVARAEDLPREDVLNDLALAGYDVVAIRVLGAVDGALDLDKLLAVLREGRSAIAAAASAAAAKTQRRNYAGRQPEQVAALLEHVRVGQTSRGSFTAPILVPYAFDPGEVTPATGEWLGRRVMRKLAAAFASVQRALARSGEEAIGSLASAVADGISANLCLALGRLADEAGDVELSIRWASAEPEEVVPPLRLAAADAPVLKRAASRLAEADPPPTEELIGFVVELSDETSTDGSHAVIEAQLDGKQRRVEALVDAAHRPAIADAWRQRRSVLVEGALHRSGRKLVLTEIERVERADVEE